MKIAQRARPVRVAYFVDYSNYEVILDEIASASFGLWGGRFHLVVPYLEGSVTPAYRRWLKAYDPDVIYSYVDLAENEVAALNEEYCPAFLRRHSVLKNKKEALDAYDLRPRLPFPALSIETVLPLVTRPNAFGPYSDASVIEQFMGRSSNDRFGLVNFGEFLHSVGHSYPNYLTPYAQPARILADDDLQPRKRYGLREAPTFQNTIELVERHSIGPVPLTMNGLSSQAPRLEINNHPWSHSFNIVVGDHLVDRVSYWNARALYPRWRDRQPVDLYLPTSVLDDGGLIDAIREYLLRRNQVNYMQSGPGRAVIRSSSLPVERLLELAKRLTNPNGFMVANHQEIASIDDVCPSEQMISESYLAFQTGIGSALRQGWERFDVPPNEFSVQPVRPDHLKFCPPELLTRHEGAWAVDVVIERTNDYSPFTNVKQDWVLPRRLRFVSAFRKSYQLSGDGAIVAPRIGRNGELCLFADANTTLGPVSVPTDEYAITFGYVRGRDWWPLHEYRAGEQMPAQAAAKVKRSSNGQKFKAVLDLFGGLSAAQGILLHRFWQQQFERMGASQAKGDTRRDALRRLLEKRLRGSLKEPVENVLEVLADHALAVGDTQRNRPPRVRWSELQSDHNQMIESYKVQLEHFDEMQLSEWILETQGSLEPALQRLCKLGVFFQGYELSCRTCSHKTWISLEEMSTQVRCGVCGTEAPLPIDRDWDFRLNEFLKDAMRSHGVVPLFWAIQRARDQRETSFYYEGPLDVYLTTESVEQGRHDTDVDLTLIRDGKVEIVEAKSSTRHLRKAADLAEVALKVRPDIATIAVMEATSPRVQATFREFSDRLAGSGIAPRLITLEEHDLSDQPSLHEVLSYRVF